MNTRSSTSGPAPEAANLRRSSAGTCPRALGIAGTFAQFMQGHLVVGCELRGPIQDPSFASEAPDARKRARMPSDENYRYRPPAWRFRTKRWTVTARPGHRKRD